MNMNLNMINVDHSRLVPIIAVTFILSFDSLFRFIVSQQRAINLRHSIFQDPSTWICQRIEWFGQLEWHAFKSYSLLELVSQQSSQKSGSRIRRLVLTMAVATSTWPLVLWYVWFTTKAMWRW